MARRLDVDALAVDLERNAAAGMGRGGGHEQRGDDKELFHVSLLVMCGRLLQLARTLVQSGSVLCDWRHDATAAFRCPVTVTKSHPVERL